MDHIALLEGAVDRFEQQPLPKGGPALASFLERVQRVNDRIALKNSEAAAAFAETDHYEDEGFCSPQHWMRVNLHMTGGASGVVCRYVPPIRPFSPQYWVGSPRRPP